MSIDTRVEALWNAWKRFAVGKRRTPAFDHFAYHLEDNLRALSHELTTRSYRHAGYSTFVVRDPKRRQIAVAGIRDRVVHRLVYDALVERFDCVFLFDVWSCREGKGLHAAIDRAQRFLASFPRAAVWRADIARFFDSVDHGVLRTCLRRRVADPRTWFLLDQVIDSYPPAAGRREPPRGIPIGNVTSQVFANIVLHELDRFVIHTARPLRYLRYGDDFLLLTPGRAEAEDARQTVAAFLRGSLRLHVHRRNDAIVAARQGLHFCGYDIFPSGRRLKLRTVSRWQSRMRPGTIGSYHGLVRSERRAKTLRAFHWRVLRAVAEGRGSGSTRPQPPPPRH